MRIKAFLDSARVTLPAEHFVILDGALYPELFYFIDEAGLRATPLFLEGGNEDVTAAGPFLAPLDEDNQSALVAKMVGDGRLPVIWSWPAGQQLLYRHLRTINLATIPHEPLPESHVDYVWYQNGDSRSVIFRHWDPNVLALTLDVLTPEQQGGLLDVAAAIAFWPDHSSHPVIHRHVSAMCEDGQRPLAFSPEQVRTIGKRQGERVLLNVIDYLYDAAPEPCATLGPDKVREHARLSLVESRRLGAASEGAHCRWAYLQLVSARQMLASPGVSEMLTLEDANVSTDKRIRLLMDGIVDQLRAGV